jgi:hypothetical protein
MSEGSGWRSASLVVAAAALAVIPLVLLSDFLHPSMTAFVVVYGLDWVATVPPTATLCRQAFGEAGSVVFGWVFAAHQIGAAIVSVGAGSSTTPPASTPWPGSGRPACAWSRPSSRPGSGGRPRRSALDRPPW